MRRSLTLDEFDGVLVQGLTVILVCPAHNLSGLFIGRAMFGQVGDKDDSDQ